MSLNKRKVILVAAILVVAAAAIVLLVSLFTGGTIEDYEGTLVNAIIPYCYS